MSQAFVTAAPGTTANMMGSGTLHTNNERLFLCAAAATLEPTSADTTTKLELLIHDFKIMTFFFFHLFLLTLLCLQEPHQRSETISISYNHHTFMGQTCKHYEELPFLSCFPPQPPPTVTAASSPLFHYKLHITHSWF